MPVVLIPDGPPYRIHPIHVEAYAGIMVEAAGAGDDYTLDAVGAEQPEVGKVIHEVADTTGSPGKARRLRARPVQADDQNKTPKLTRGRWQYSDGQITLNL